MNLRYPLVLVALAGLLFFSGLGARDLWAPVEPRYGEIARVMLARGDWIVPRVNGELYTDKPILYFWLVLLFSKLAGAVNEWTVRLPSALSALGLVLTTYFLGRDFFGAKIGFMAAIVLATSARVLWEGRWAHTDVALTFFFTLSLHFFLRAICQKGRPREFLLAYGCMALATLTKGLIAVVLPALILLAFTALRREWDKISQWRIPSGIMIFLLVSIPWLASVSLATGGTWLEEFVLTHHVRRYLAGAGHRQPWFYYLVNLPLDFLPWTVFVIPALVAYGSRLRLLREPIPLFFSLWFLGIFLFFNFSDTKRGLYLLPLFPPAALFVACYIDRLVSGDIPQDRFYRWVSCLFFGLLSVTSLALPVAAWLFEREAFGLSVPMALIMAGGGLMTVRSVSKQLPSKVFFFAALTVSLGMFYAAVWVLPYLDRYKSPRPFALRVKEAVPLAEPLYVYADTMNDFNFYTERERIPVLSSKAEVDDKVRDRGAYLLIRDRDLKRMKLEARVVTRGRVGEKQWYLVQLSPPKRGS